MAKQIKYVGTKEDGETAFFHETGGITWMPGDSHPVPEKVAERMLKHPDVFAEDEEQVQNAAPAVAAGAVVAAAKTKPVATKKVARKNAKKA